VFGLLVDRGEVTLFAGRESEFPIFDASDSPIYGMRNTVLSGYLSWDAYDALRFRLMLANVLPHAKLVKEAAAESHSRVLESFENGSFYRWKQSGVFQELGKNPAVGQSIEQWRCNLSVDGSVL